MPGRDIAELRWGWSMTIKVSLQNSAGEIDSRTVESPVDAVEAVAEMVREAGELFGGDKIIISDSDEEQT
jgi:hypothetical protein